MADEKRLVDVTPIIERYSGGEHVKSTAECVYDSFFVSVLKNAPTVDAVEVVRCRDCKHWHEETGWCNQHSHFVDIEGEACHPWESSEWNMFDESDFCSYGERRNDGNG